MSGHHDAHEAAPQGHGRSAQGGRHPALPEAPLLRDVHDAQPDGPYLYLYLSLSLSLSLSLCIYMYIYI